MEQTVKRTTIYLDPALHRALKLKSIETQQSMTELVNEAVRTLLAEDEEDLQSFRDRAAEPAMEYEAVLKELRRHGKL
ncbi:CopG family transcriptional regulator [bacterium]|nr:CopG family transcriptional regulator [bacterium]